MLLSYSILLRHNLLASKPMPATPFDWITFAKHILGARACLRRMRITVSLGVNLVAHGMAPNDILSDYPDLELEDIQQALAYSNWLNH